MDLAQVDGFLFDVDGTLVLSGDPNTGSGGIELLAGSSEVLAMLRHRGKRVACLTNGTGQTPGDLAAKLRRAGLQVADDEMLTPAVVAVEYIRRRCAGQPVLAFGTRGVLGPLEAAAIPLVRLEDAERAAVVLIGADPEFTYQKLEAACRAVWAGARLLVTSMAPFFVARGGRMPSTSGAIAAGIRHATGVEPIVVGKPAPLAMEMVAAMFGTSVHRIAVVGDDLDLEVAMARTCGAFSVLVLSGTTTASRLDGIAPEAQPDLVVSVIGDLLALLK